MLLRFLTRFCYISHIPKVNLSDETTPAQMDYALAPSEHGSASVFLRAVPSENHRVFAVALLAGACAASRQSLSTSQSSALKIA
jgi:hypothetical protein